ncbi:MAG: HU family DNA-binding protein [Candidatus Tumulicola sp.]
MNKVDLTRSAMERLELSRKDAVALIDGVFEDIQAAVVSGEPVKIPGFGQFKVRDRAARMARNPATGAQVKVPAKRVFKFLPAKALKEAVMAKRSARASAAKAKKAPARGAAKPAAKKAAPRKAVTRKVAPRKATAAKKSTSRKKRR